MGKGIQGFLPHVECSSAVLVPLTARWAELVVKEGKGVERSNGEDLPHRVPSYFSHTLMGVEIIKYM